MAVKRLNEDTTTLYRVIVKSPSGYSRSPEFSYQGGCSTWIANQLFDTGAKVSIEEIRRYDVHNTKLNYYLDYEEKLPREVTDSKRFNRIASNVFRDGCVDKNSVDNIVAEIQDYFDKEKEQDL